MHIFENFMQKILQCVQFIIIKNETKGALLSGNFQNM